MVLQRPYQVHPNARVSSILQQLIALPYDDPRIELCTCGCGVPVEANTLTNYLCQAMLEQAGYDYSQYKKLYDACANQLDAAPGIPWLTLMGFKAHARNTGVDRYGWAIVNEEAAIQSLQICLRTAAATVDGPAEFHPVISIGAGISYAESVFQRALKKLGQNTEVMCFDIFPQCYQSYLPLHYGTPETIIDAFQTMRGMILMLVWPPIGHLLPDGRQPPAANAIPNPMASDALRRFVAKGGRFLIYIGEKVEGGCTGDPEFHRMLRDGRWTLLNEDPHGNSTVHIDKWCPNQDASVSGTSFISGVSGNDSLWIYFLKHPLN